MATRTQKLGTPFIYDENGKIISIRSPNNLETNLPQIYNALADRPPASEFGVGIAQVDGAIYVSDGATWSSLAIDSGATTAPYDFGGFYQGTLPADEIVLGFIATRDVTLPAGLTDSRCEAKVPATAETVLSLELEGTPVGSITFAAAGTVGTFSFVSQDIIGAGETFEVIAPAVADLTLANVFLTFAGTRAT